MNDFWRGKRVFITGHTGFKGSWLSLWLIHLGAIVSGFALKPPTVPNLYGALDLDAAISSTVGDICDCPALFSALKKAEPEVVFHMAAQPLVLESYRNPTYTFHTNIMGTVNVMEAIRSIPSVKVFVNVTTDKCYENREWIWGYRENEPLGGKDPYSSSKACSELITASYRNSFFNSSISTAIVSVRAGNVIGGGDWAENRLVPDCIRSLQKGEPIIVRNPLSVRPWQHVLEPLSGYLLLAEKAYHEPVKYSESWNFGPKYATEKSVEWIVKTLCNFWGNNAGYTLAERSVKNEASYLKLDCSKAEHNLGWVPKWTIQHALNKTVEWAKAYYANKDIYGLSLKHVREYESMVSEEN